MAEIRIGIGRVKREISELVNRVAYRGERIILTSHGKPKAALVSIEDYERLQGQQTEQALLRWKAWLAESDALNAQILEHRQGRPLDMDAAAMMSGFSLVDRYIGARLGADLSAFGNEGVAVVESPRRLRREQSYGFIHALWWFWLTGGRSVVSAPPGVGEAIGEVSREVRSAEQLSDQALVARLRSSVDAALLAAGLPATDRVQRSLWFACDAAHLRRHPGESCRRLTDESVPPAEGLQLPGQCFPDGIVYGAVADGRVVSVAYAHRSGFMEDQVADLGVETAPAYRRRGYARAVVSAVVEHITRTGGEAVYCCAPDNQPSSATARSVGFVPYGTSLTLSTPADPS